MKAAIALFIGGLLYAQQPADFKVRLTAPLTTKMSRPGDLVVGKIVEPAQYAGGYLEGEVREVHPGSAAKPATIDFIFHSLHAGGKDSRVSLGVVQVVNSRHQPDVDEDGAGIRQERAGSGSAGSLSRLRTGVMSRISKGSDKQAPAPPAAITRLASTAPQLSLASGSELTLRAIAPASK